MESANTFPVSRNSRLEMCLPRTWVHRPFLRHTRMDRAHIPSNTFSCRFRELSSFQSLPRQSAQCRRVAVISPTLLNWEALPRRNCVMAEISVCTYRMCANSRRRICFETSIFRRCLQASWSSNSRGPACHWSNVSALLVEGISMVTVASSVVHYFCLDCYCAKKELRASKGRLLGDYKTLLFWTAHSIEPVAKSCPYAQVLSSRTSPTPTGDRPCVPTPPHCTGLPTRGTGPYGIRQCLSERAWGEGTYLP